MISFHKKLIAIALLASVFSQAVAMKRKTGGPLSDPTTHHKSMDQGAIFGTSAKLQPAISSGWPKLPIRPTVPHNPAYIVLPGQKNQPEDLRASSDEQALVEQFASKYYIGADGKFADAMGARDFEETSRHAQKLSTLKAHPFGVVAGIVASDFSKEQKIKLFDKLEKRMIGESPESLTKLFNQPSASGFTPLELAVKYDHYSMVHDLIHRGADPKGLDQQGEPVFLQIKNVEIAKRFLAAGVPIDITGGNGETILFNNASLLPEDRAIATLFIANGGNVNQKNIGDQTAFEKEELYGTTENPDLSEQDWAFEMTRENLGVTPGMVFARQTGQFQLKKW